MASNVMRSLMRDENSVTRLLVALCQLKPIRDVVVRKFTGGAFGAESVRCNEISDQVSIGVGRPDLEMRTEEVHVLVEIKISPWTALQDSQPRNYLEWLNGTNVHAPSRYLVLLTPPEYQPLREFFMRHDEYRAKNPSSNISTLQMDWLQLADALETEELTEAIPYVRDFCSVLRSWYTPEKISFQNAELMEADMFSQVAAQAHIKIFSLIQALAVELEKSGVFVTTKNFKKDWWRNSEYGIYIKEQTALDDEVLWIGLWMDYWSETGNPICIGIHQNWRGGKLAETFKECFDSVTTFESYLVTPVDKRLLMHDAVKDVMQWLQRYLTHFTNPIFPLVSAPIQELAEPKDHRR